MGLDGVVDVGIFRHVGLSAVQAFFFFSWTATSWPLDVTMPAKFSESPEQTNVEVLTNRPFFPKYGGTLCLNIRSTKVQHGNLSTVTSGDGGCRCDTLQ
jgi:hypothetical protein